MLFRLGLKSKLQEKWKKRLQMLRQKSTQV